MKKKVDEVEYAQIFNDGVTYWLALGYTIEQARAASQHKIDCMRKLEGRAV